MLSPQQDNRLWMILLLAAALRVGLLAAGGEG